MQIREIMSSEVITVKTDDDVKKAASLVCLPKHSGIPVVDEEGKLIGMVSERDIVETVYPSYREFFDHPGEFKVFADLTRMYSEAVRFGEPAAAVPVCNTGIELSDAEKKDFKNRRPQVEKRLKSIERFYLAQKNEMQKTIELRHEEIIQMKQVIAKKRELIRQEFVQNRLIELRNYRKEQQKMLINIANDRQKAMDIMRRDVLKRIRQTSFLRREATKF